MLVHGYECTAMIRFRAFCFTERCLSDGIIFDVLVPPVGFVLPIFFFKRGFGSLFATLTLLKDSRLRIQGYM